LLIEFVQQDDLRIRIGLREGHSFRGSGACSEEVFGNLDIERRADPGIELGWEAGIRAESSERSELVEA
jgi:hypothetical protein